MIDLLPIPCRIADAAATGGRAHDQLGELIRGAKSTPSDIQILVQEVERLSRILGELEGVLKNKEYNEELLLNLRTVCGGFSEFKSLVHRVKNRDEKSAQQFENWRRVSQEKRAAALMSQLEVYNVALSKISHISADAQTTSDKDTTSRFEEAMREIAQIFSRQGEENDAAKYPAFIHALIKRCVSGRSASYSLAPTPHVLDQENTTPENGNHRQVYSPPESPHLVFEHQIVYGNVIQMRREMRLVCRRAAKENGSIPLV